MKLVYSTLIWRFSGVLFLVLFFSACQSNNSTVTRFENSPLIDSLLASAPHFVVNTDTEAERWIADIEVGFPRDTLILGELGSLIAIGDAIYVSDRQSEAIFAIGSDGYIFWRIGVAGKAPGEFTSLSELHYNGLHVFALDRGRVQVFTEQFDYINAFPHLDPGVKKVGISASPNYILVGCLENSGFSICARSASPPFPLLESRQFLPVLELDDRTGEDRFFVTISPNGNRIAAGYPGLPYIFIYDDQFVHLKTIRFEGKDVRNFTPTGLPKGVPVGNLEPLTSNFIIKTRFLNSRYLIARVNKLDNYIFDLFGGDYQLAGKMILRPPNDPEEEGNIPAHDFLLYRDRLYVSSLWAEYLYGYKFEL